jgi:hypothetical protein
MSGIFGRVFGYVFNELLVNGLANSRTFQQFAVRTDKALREAKQSGARGWGWLIHGGVKKAGTLSRTLVAEGHRVREARLHGETCCTLSACTIVRAPHWRSCASVRPTQHNTLQAQGIFQGFTSRTLALLALSTSCTSRHHID